MAMNNHQFPATDRRQQSMLRAAVPLTAMALVLVFTLRAWSYSPPFAVDEVAPGNFVHPGKQVGLEDADRDDIANIGFIVGEKCVAVIDTGGSVKVGMALKAAVRERTQTPICYVINTHVHFDHLLGNAAFRDENPEFVGHAELPGAITVNRRFFLENFAAELGGHASEADIIAPGRTVETELELDLGGRTLVLKAYPTAHTHADLSVLDTSTGTLWTGDLLFRERIPSLDGSIKGWLGVIDAIEQQLDVQVIVPGHGPVTDDLRQAFGDEKRYLQLLVDQVRAYVGEGKPLDQAMEEIGLTERARWQLFDEVNKRNVSRAFSELEWE